MKRDEFMKHIESIMFAEGYQCVRQRVIKSSVHAQRKAINTLTKELGLKKLSYDEVIAISYG